MNNIFANGITPELVWDMLRRRFWIAIALFSVAVTAVVSVVTFLPNTYRATAVILIEGQQIPTSFVRSTVTMSVDRRLQVIGQEILSRARLEKLITDFDLYPELRKKGMEVDLLAGQIRRDIDIQSRGRSRETVAFSLSFTYPDPRKAAQVANALASFYMEENQKIRERQSIGTTDFLKAELEDVKRRIEGKEREIALFKQKYGAELPDAMNSNVSAVNRLHGQLDEAQQERARLLQNRKSIEQKAQDALAKLDNDDNADDPTLTPNQQLQALNNQLANLRTHLSEKHPDVILIKDRIEAVEQQIAARGGVPEDPREAIRARLESEQSAIDDQVRRLNGAIAELKGQIDTYQGRIERAPDRGLQLAAITRGYDTTVRLYNDLLSRLQQASISDSLEQNEKAEQFRLLEPAVQPSTPFAPKRLKYYMMALVLGLGLAGGAVLLLELFDTSFHRLEDLRSEVPIPVLVSIPQIAVKGDKPKRIIWRTVGCTALLVSLVLIVGTSYKYATGNDELLRLIAGG